MKIEIGINWPLASELPATAVPASCCSGCLHPERPLADVGWRVLKQFSHARLWRKKKHGFSQIFPQTISIIKALSCVLTAASISVQNCALISLALANLGESNGKYWLIMVDQTDHFSTRTRLWLCTRRFGQKGELLSSTLRVSDTSPLSTTFQFFSYLS